MNFIIYKCGGVLVMFKLEFRVCLFMGEVSY